MVKDAIILAGGKAKRMKKTNENAIKPLVMVNDKILVGYVIEALINKNVENIHIIKPYYENLDIIKNNYKNANINFYNHDNMYSALVALNMLKDIIKGNFILSDCDVISKVSSIENMLNYGFNYIDKCDGLVTACTNPSIENNHYLEVKDGKIIGFDKQGKEENIHGGFMYIFNNNFYTHMNKYMDKNDMAYILDSYFRNYNVLPMYIDDVHDIDEESEIKKFSLKK